MPETSAVDVKEASDVAASPKLSIFKKIVSNITIEPLVICWLLPFLLTYAAIENLNIEKACREFVDPSKDGFSKDICQIFVKKAALDINCDGSEVSQKTLDDVSKQFPEVYEEMKKNISSAMTFLCDTEEKVQLKLSNINAIRNPIAAIGPLLVIGFAGPWSDKKNLRVPCMLIPLIGEALGYLCLLISAIFINGPVEFPAYAYRLLPSLTGAENLMVMAIFSYLSAISTEENRTFRFGMFQILMTIVPIIAQSLSPTINANFGYAQLFGMMVPVHIAGILYAVIFLKEVKPEPKEDAAYDNPAMDTELQNRNNASTLQIGEAPVEEAKNACLEFFDPRLAQQCVQSLFKKRDYGLRNILLLLMLMHLITNGVVQGEGQNIFLYQRVKLGWDIDTNTYHNVFSIVLGLIGTLLMAGILSKYLKVPDLGLTMISTALTFVSRVVYSIVTSTRGFFIGTAIDFCSSVKFLGSRAAISKLVPSEDLSTMFAVMGLCEALAGLVFAYIYPTIYQILIDSKVRDVSEMFHLSAGLMLIAFIVYSLVFRLMKTKDEEEEEDNMRSKNSTKF